MSYQEIFYAFDIEKAIDDITNNCHQCAALQKIPQTLVEQITSGPPEVVGMSFTRDVMKREKQLILVVRECVTSYTVAAIIENERHETLHGALIPLCIGIRPLDGPPAVVRIDPAPGSQALVDDELLRDCRI